MPEMIPVESSNLAAVGYDEQLLELHVQFKNGAVWVYRAVPADVYQNMTTAPSKGRYFAQQIKPRFQGSKL